MLALIAAISKNNCIGKDGSLPWHIPEDMAHFKSLTMGNTVLMGRKTWESIPEKFRPLPGRKNVIVTRQENFDAPEGVEVFFDLDEALEANKEKNIFVIGGGQIYTQTIDRADTLYLTRVAQYVEGCDVFFPNIDPSLWQPTQREDHDGFSFVTYAHK